MPRVTLKQLAENLGLSVMAVSKALRDAPDISATTKERIRKEASRLGYVPNRFAQSLRSGSTRAIGFIAPALNEAPASNVLVGLETEARSHGFDLIVASSLHNGELEKNCFLGMLERHVDAIFILPIIQLQHRSPLLDAAEHYRTPLVFIDRYPPNISRYPNVGWVTADNFKAAELATENLIGFGHKKIIYLSGPPTASSCAEHYTGFRRALEKTGIPFNEKRVFNAGYDVESGKGAITQALSEDRDFTGVVCINDAVAIGACSKLRAEGVRVPKDVSVIGAGGGILAENCSPSLTTVFYPQVEMGRVAFLQWHHSKTKNAPIGSRVLPVELIQRESTQSRA